MRITLIHLFLLSNLCLLGPCLLAQNQDLLINGTIVESNHQEPVEFATVMVLDTKSQEAVGGTTSSADGTFSIRVATQQVYVQISFIGFETQIIQDISHQKWQSFSRQDCAAGSHYNYGRSGHTGRKISNGIQAWTSGYSE